jgi:hypothetical protein
VAGPPKTHRMQTGPQSHHYVPKWYQKRFLKAGEEKIRYLNLRPDKVRDGKIRYTKRSLRNWAPARCFQIDDLYSMRFGKETTDALERILFGRVDGKGALAVDFFNGYQNLSDETHEAFRNITAYIGAQRFRTPRGLDWIKTNIGLRDHTQTLIAMSRMFRLYDAMWMEGVWEIVHSKAARTPFIISDEPVTFFNRSIFPGEDAYPGGDDFPKVGTRTIFPLSKDSCLIITHLQFVRNPWNKPLAIRENARQFGRTLANLTDIQFGRELEEIDVLRINHILKVRATRFIGAGAEEDLYPEERLGKVDWAKLDDDWFLLPNPWKVGFTTGIMMGGGRAGTFAMDEYGRNPGDPRFEDRRRRQEEHESFDRGKEEWAKRRLGKSLARVADVTRENTVGDDLMNEYLAEQGLLPR